MSRLIKKSGKSERRKKNYKNNGYKNMQSWMTKCLREFKS